jgi:hypothetical protein
VYPIANASADDIQWDVGILLGMKPSAGSSAASAPVPAAVEAPEEEEAEEGEISSSRLPVAKDYAEILQRISKCDKLRTGNNRRPWNEVKRLTRMSRSTYQNYSAIKSFVEAEGLDPENAKVNEMGKSDGIMKWWSSLDAGQKEQYLLEEEED